MASALTDEVAGTGHGTVDAACRLRARCGAGRLSTRTVCTVMEKNVASLTQVVG
jgi:hypothetical protein